MGKYLVGIDGGTTGCKTVVFDFEGNVMGSDYREYPCYYPQAGWVEQTAEDMTPALFESCKAAISKSKVDPKDIISMALSTQGSVWGPLDKDKKLIRPFIGWQDVRGAAYVEKISKGEYISAERYYEITGYPISTTPAMTKYLWYKDNEAENFKKTEYFISHQDYFLKEFGAEDWFVNDLATACRTGVFDVNNKEWSTEIFDALGLDKNKFAKIKTGGDVVGKISHDISLQTGLVEGTLICVGAMDQNCSYFGGGLVENGTAVGVVGTYGAIYVAVDKPMRDPNRTLIFTNNSGPENYTFEAASITAASSYRWYRDTFANLESAYAKVANEDVYDLINREIEKVPPGSNGLIFLPYLQGAGSGPRSDSYARGSFLGITLGTSKQEIARAVMEGITLEMRDNIESIRRMGIELKEMRIVGGATKCELWNQMHADMNKIPVLVLEASETGCLGAALYAGVGGGIYKDYKDASEKAIRIKKIYYPNEENFKAYDNAYECFITGYEALNKGNFFKLLNEQQMKGE